MSHYLLTCKRRKKSWRYFLKKNTLILYNLIPNQLWGKFLLQIILFILHTCHHLLTNREIWSSFKGLHISNLYSELISSFSSWAILLRICWSALFATHKAQQDHSPVHKRCCLLAWKIFSARLDRENWERGDLEYDLLVSRSLDSSALEHFPEVIFP